MRRWNGAVSGKVQVGALGKVLSPWGGWSLEQVPQGNKWSWQSCQSSRSTWTMPLILCLVLGIPVRRRELLILVGPFQLETI